MARQVVLLVLPVLVLLATVVLACAMMTSQMRHT